MKRSEDGPLSGIRVLDMTRVLSGPYCTMMLADMGAEVIKIEMPEVGDDSRHFGPFKVDKDGNEFSSYFSSINRNKKSITLNLKKPEAAEIFKRLVVHADVVIENFRPGTMKKMGINYEVIKEINPKIIYASISGFGQYGPYAGRAAYDGIVQAMGGVMSITGEKGGKPVKVGTSIGDIIAGMFCAYGILAAYIDLKKTNKGQYVDVSMLDSQVAVLENAISRYLSNGIVPQPTGNTHTSIFPFETFETATNDIMIAAGNNSLWKKLCNVVSLPELAEDPRFKENPDRGKNHDEMYELLNEQLKKKKGDEWVSLLDEAGVPCSLINTMDMVLENKQLEARNMFVDMENPRFGTEKLIGIPVKMSESPGKIRIVAPMLGADTKAVLKELVDLTDSELDDLKKAGTI